MSRKSTRKGHTKLPSFGELTRNFATVAVASDPDPVPTTSQERLPQLQEESTSPILDNNNDNDNNINSNNNKQPHSVPETPTRFPPSQMMIQGQLAQNGFQFPNRNNSDSALIHHIGLQQLPQSHGDPHVRGPMMSMAIGPQILLPHPPPPSPPPPISLPPSMSPSSNPQYLYTGNPMYPQRFPYSQPIQQRTFFSPHQPQFPPNIIYEAVNNDKNRAQQARNSDISPTDTRDPSFIPYNPKGNPAEVAENEDYFTKKSFRFPPVAASSSNPRRASVATTLGHKRSSSQRIQLNEEDIPRFRGKRRENNDDKDIEGKRSGSSTPHLGRSDSTILLTKLEEMGKNIQCLDESYSEYVKIKPDRYERHGGNRKKERYQMASDSQASKKSKRHTGDNDLTELISKIPERALDQMLDSAALVNDAVNELKSFKSRSKSEDNNTKSGKKTIKDNSRLPKASLEKQDLFVVKKSKRHQRNALSEGSIKADELNPVPSILSMGETTLLNVGPIAPHIVTRGSVSFSGSQVGLHQELSMKKEIVCLQCGSTETPEWRKGPEGARTLCNACGLFHSKLVKKVGEKNAEDEMKVRRESGRGNDRKVN